MLKLALILLRGIDVTKQKTSAWFSFQLFLYWSQVNLWPESFLCCCQSTFFFLFQVLYILYKFYDIFTLEFKKILNGFFLSNIFYSLFLHWCTNVRQMFHHLIYFKILQKKIANPEEVSESCNTSRSQNKSQKCSSYSEECLLNLKICHSIRAIENFTIDLSKEVKN
jgi:hypothetical protein